VTQRESRLSRSILAKLAAEPEVFAWKNHGSEFTMAGLPDIIVCYRGRFIGLEVKNPGEKHKVSAVQELVHRMIRDAGGKVYVVSSVAEAVACIRLNPQEPGAVRSRIHPSMGNLID